MSAAPRSVSARPPECPLECAAAAHDAGAPPHHAAAGRSWCAGCAAVGHRDNRNRAVGEVGQLNPAIGLDRAVIEVSERLDRLHMSFDEHAEVSGEHIARLDSRFDNVNARCDRADLQLQAAAWVGLVWAPAAVLLAYLAGRRARR